jgi:WD40 repeat protein
MFTMADTPAPKDSAAAQPPAAAIKSVKTVDLKGDNYSIVAIPDSDLVFVGGDTGKIQAIDMAAEKPTQTGWDAHVSFVTGLVLTARHLVSSGSDHQMIWWDRETRERVRSVPHPKWVRHLALSPDGQMIASVCDDMVCRLWEAESGKPIRRLEGHVLRTPFHFVSKLYASAFSPDGKLLATVDQAGHALVWETATGRQVADVLAPFFYTHDTNGHTYGGIRAVDFSPDGRRIALGGNLAGDTSTIGGSKALIQVYDWQSGKLASDFRGGNFFYERVRFHHDGQWLLGMGSAGSGQKLTLVDRDGLSSAAEADVKGVMFDLWLSKQSDVCFLAGRGSVTKWSISGGS